MRRSVSPLASSAALVLAVGVSGCVIGPSDSGFFASAPGDATAGGLLAFAPVAPLAPDCAETHNGTQTTRAILGPTHMTGPMGRTGAQATLSWSEGPDLVESFRLDVRWTAASLLTKRLEVNFTYGPEAKDLNLEGASPLSQTFPVEGALLAEHPRAFVWPSAHDAAVASAGPEQSVELELTQTYRRC